MINRYQHLHHTGSGIIPQPSDFSGVGEIAVNTADGALYTIDPANNIVKLGNIGGVSVSASYAATASLLLGGVSNALTATSASFATNALTANSATTASYAASVTSASYAGVANSSTSTLSASFAQQAIAANSALFATNATAATTASYTYTASVAITASYALNGGGGGAGISSSFATTASYASNIPRNTVVFISGSYTASAADDIIIITPAAATASVYLPSVSANSGIPLLVRRAGNSIYPVVVVPNGSNTIDGFSSVVLVGANATVGLTSNGVSDWIAGASASYAGTLTLTSASYATTASYALNGGGGGASSSYATTASYASVAQNVLGSITSASNATTASFALSIPRTNVVIITGSYTASAANDAILIYAPSATASVYLPAVSTNSGESFLVRKVGSSIYPVLIIPAGSDTIDGNPGVQLLTQYAQVSLVSNGLTQWMGGAIAYYSGSSSVSASYAASSSIAAISVLAVTSSYAMLAQNVLGSITSASYALTASYALNGGGGGGGVSSSYATTASYASIAQNVLGSITSASFATTASYAQFAKAVSGSIQSASFAATASYAPLYLPLAGGTLASDLFMNSNINMGDNNVILGPGNDIIQGGTVGAAGLRLDSVFGVSLCGDGGAGLILRATMGQVGITGSLQVSGSIRVLAPYSITASNFVGTASLATTASLAVSAQAAAFTFGIGTGTPTSTADASGVTGQILYDSSYIYVKTVAGWKRSALTTF
jgi:hypothetical protein